jgi:hypothetical protein
MYSEPNDKQEMLDIEKNTKKAVQWQKGLDSEKESCTTSR